MAGLGHVIIGGDRFPIEAVRLCAGGVLVDFSVRGPHPAIIGPVTVFGEDGQGCWQGKAINIAKVHRREIVRFSYKMTITAVE